MQGIVNSRKWAGGVNGLPITAEDSHQVITPWPPPNIFFGVSITNQAEADKYLPLFQQIRELGPFKLWVSYEPAIEAVDWMDSNWGKVLDWLVVGGESGDGAREMNFGAVENTVNFGRLNKTPVYVKQMGSAWAKETGRGDSKGVDTVPPFFNVRQFPDISKSYIEWR